MPGAEASSTKNPVIFRPIAEGLVEKLPPCFHHFGRKRLPDLERLFAFVVVALIVPLTPKIAVGLARVVVVYFMMMRVPVMMFEMMCVSRRIAFRFQGTPRVLMGLWNIIMLLSHGCFSC